jgi:hypothetical protein
VLCWVLLSSGIEPSSEHFASVELLQLDFPVELTAEALVGAVCHLLQLQCVS